LLSSLTNSKVDPIKKIEIYQTLGGKLSNTPGKEQYILDSLCSFLESICKKDK